VKLLLTSLSGVGREHFTVSATSSSNSEKCCTIFKVILTGTHDSFNADGAKAQVEGAIASDDRFSVISPSATTDGSRESSDAPVVAISVALMLVLAALLF